MKTHYTAEAGAIKDGALLDHAQTELLKLCSCRHGASSPLEHSERCAYRIVSVRLATPFVKLELEGLIHEMQDAADRDDWPDEYLQVTEEMIEVAQCRIDEVSEAAVSK